MAVLLIVLSFCSSRYPHFNLRLYALLDYKASLMVKMVLLSGLRKAKAKNLIFRFFHLFVQNCMLSYTNDLHLLIWDSFLKPRLTHLDILQRDVRCQNVHELLETL